ncbi:MAG: hypothetical protein DYG98_02040 [Haliscomenobacteraceae bacterium CHB4]|nr:hypothetical protein [Haliscomenobacteraceae bacterium CHB4]
MKQAGPIAFDLLFYWYRPFSKRPQLSSIFFKKISGHPIHMESNAPNTQKPVAPDPEDPRFKKSETTHIQ